jgi:hypothetical protein
VPRVEILGVDLSSDGHPSQTEPLLWRSSINVNTGNKGFFSLFCKSALKNSNGGLKDWTQAQLDEYEHRRDRIQRQCK